MIISAEELINKAVAAKEQAYAPYSRFRVGAAVLTEEGRCYTGCNVENASYGLTCCAERVAIFNAVAGGERRLQAIAIISDSEKYITPCGACRQVLIEFNPAMKVIMADREGKYREATAAELLPESFKLSNPQGAGPGRAGATEKVVL